MAGTDADRQGPQQFIVAHIFRRFNLEEVDEISSDNLTTPNASRVCPDAIAQCATTSAPFLVIILIKSIVDSFLSFSFIFALLIAQSYSKSAFQTHISHSNLRKVSLERFRSVALSVLVLIIATCGIYVVDGQLIMQRVLFKYVERTMSFWNSLLLVFVTDVFVISISDILKIVMYELYYFHSSKLEIVERPTITRNNMDEENCDGELNESSEFVVQRRWSVSQCDAPLALEPRVDYGHGDLDKRLSVSSHAQTRRKKALLIVDILAFMYRQLLPMPVWCSYLSHGLLGVVLVCGYVGCKLFTLRQCAVGAAQVLVICAGNDLEFGQYKPTAAGGVCCDCPICFDCKQHEVSLSCGHSFCEVCITEWLDKDKTCPVCRAAITPNHDCINLIKTKIKQPILL